ncbi:MAG: metallophosphoesterase family protein [Coriobacteriia bacterium]|nr:metallophosphoesterase family protein [Coriobacteriia bacterium]
MASRRIAVYSDIHANVAALEAVLGHIVCAGIAERYCLGDLVGYGSDPSGVIARIRAAGDPVIRGNYDDGVGKRLGACGCSYATEEAQAAGAESYACTDAALGDAEREYLATLPDDIRLDVSGARVLLCHGSPRRIDEYLMPDRSDSDLAELADFATADIVGVGHVHVPYHRVLLADDGRAVHYVSDGSVGQPRDGDARPCWAELVFGAKAEVNAACEGDRAAGPVGMPRDGERVWLGVIFHRSEMEGAGCATAEVHQDLAAMTSGPVPRGRRGSGSG